MRVRFQGACGVALASTSARVCTNGVDEGRRKGLSRVTEQGQALEGNTEWKRALSRQVGKGGG